MAARAQKQTEAGMTLDTRIARYFSDYDSKTFDVMACGEQAPTESQLARVEKKLGVRFPDDFRAFTCSPLGGMYMAVKETLWPPPEPYEVGPFWSFLRGLRVFGVAKGIPEFLDVKAQAKDFPVKGLVPFMALEGSADRYCFDLQGRIVEWFHDDSRPRRLEGMTFAKLLMREVSALEKRTAKKLAQRRSKPASNAKAKATRVAVKKKK